MTRTLSVVFLVIIALGAVTGLLGIALAPESSASANVTWVKAPEQAKATTPPEFILPELEPFVLPEGENLAKGKSVEYSDYTDVYPGKQAVDGRDRTYWEAVTLPSFITIDLEAETTVSKVVLQVPPQRNWGKRTQAISISADGKVIVPEAEYVFDAQIGNAVLIEFPPVTAQFIRVDIASNTGAKGAQLSEIYIFE
ncbi:hypothetical protein FACS189425_01260 [Clostridia bacterium]|nr:hypothetical protein FACS189425_01260 [Clostridia bacterium]